MRTRHFIWLWFALTACGNPAKPVPETCDRVTCSTPPANHCADAQHLVVSDSPGTCGAGQCTYATRQIECAAGCSEGKCNEDPCIGVTCHSPQASRCENDSQLRVFEPSGTCGNGLCAYASSLQACASGCADGACKEDPCRGVVCNGPEANRCENATQLRVFEPNGSCSAGHCAYASTLRGCQFGCDSGRCKDDPCAGVRCESPDANRCEDATHLRVFTSNGTCANGACTYASTLESCEHGCANGQCNGNPCEGVTCHQPPANSCADASSLRVYSFAGSCANGACSYASSTQACPFGCANGQCNGNPCDGVTCSQPPANSCADAANLRVYSSGGTCANSACSYASALQACPFGCANGQCNNDPCIGVICNRPPANTCSFNAKQLRVYDSSGTCGGNGTCKYSSTLHDCAFGCANGKCNNDPCLGVTCNQPPANTCADATDVRVYSSSGTCGVGGACGYTSSVQVCPFGCANGACNPDPCAGVTCSQPPPDSCVDDSHVRTYSAAGTCGPQGVCAYDSTVEPCPPPSAPTCDDEQHLRVYAPSCTWGICFDTSSVQLCQFGCDAGHCKDDPCAGSTCVSATQVTAGAVHTCALVTDGTVRCWGGDGYAQLADGTKTAQDRPVPIALGANARAQKLTAGYFFTCALMVDGTVRCWGDNEHGELGDGTTVARTAPVAVVGVGNNVRDLVAGGENACAIMAGDGSVQCWGANFDGVLGNPNGPYLQPNATLIPGFGAHVKQVAVGYNFMCALLPDTTVKCAGDNFSGSLGDGTFTNRATPVTVMTGSNVPLSNVKQLSAEGFYACALLFDGTVQCWGDMTTQSVGAVDIYYGTRSVAVPSLTNAADIELGFLHACAFLTDGSLSCWGESIFGDLGNLSTLDLPATSPVNVTALTIRAKQVAAGSYHTCAVATDGSLWCWGYNQDGELGDGTTKNHRAAVKVALQPL